MKKTLVILSFLWTAATVFTQAPTTAWLYQLGNSGQATGEVSVQVNSDGDIIVGGGFQGFYDFDYGVDDLYEKGEYFIQKLSANGTLIWVKTWNTLAFDERRKMVVDKNDNIYFCGSYHGEVDFDLGPDTAMLQNWPIFVVKLDPDGGFIWAKGFGGGNSGTSGYANHIIALAVDDNENVFLSGSFVGTANFATDDGQVLASSNGETDIFILKLDALGDFEWVKTMGDYEYDYPTKMELDPAGNVYTVGQFVGQMDVDPSENEYLLNGYGHYDAFVQKLNTNGELVWAYNLGASGYDSANALYVSDRCDVYVGGVFEYVADFDPGPKDAYGFAPAGNGDVFLQKVNCDGELQWAKVFGSPAFDLGTDIFVDDLDQVFYTGWMQTAGDIDPGADTLMTDNVDFGSYLMKLRPNGDMIWGMNTRGDQTRASKVEGDNNGYIMVIGDFVETVNFHPNPDSVLELSSLGSTDMYFHKLRHCELTYKEMNVKTCDAFMAPSNSFMIESAGVYQDTILNASGCDSVLTIQATFLTPSELLGATVISPNPTFDELKLESEVPYCGASARLWSVDGRLLLEHTIAEGATEFMISLSPFPKGTYVLMLAQKEEYVVHRVQKK